MSPCLILICAEGFCSLFQHALTKKNLSGIKSSRAGPAISYLFFADDVLIFCKADSKEAVELRRILKVYEEDSGQLVNLEKSSILFNKNVNEEQRARICQTLENVKEISQGKYLGLPMVFTRSKNQLFRYVNDRIKSKLINWKNIFLSKASK